MSQKKTAEAHLARQQRRAMRHLLNRGQGQTVHVYELATGTHQQAYGAASGSTTSVYRVIRGIGTSDDFFPSDSFRSGSFQEGWLWTDDPTLIAQGQEVQFLDDDGNKSRRYIVQRTESLGWTTEIFTRYHLAAVDKA